MQFDGKVVVVTGGARGIGRGIADRFVAAGAKVIVCGRKEAEVPGCRFVAADVREPEQCARLIATAVEQYGRVDVLVNNAGGSPPADAATASPRFSQSIVALNLMAPLWLSQHAHAAMKDGGAIVNIASVSGTRPSPGTAAYGAAKAGLLNLTQSLAVEWAPRVRVNAVIGGLIWTEQSANHYGNAEKVAQGIPLGRFGTPADMAEAVLFLAGAEWVSGACLHVHGGGEKPRFLDDANG
jgi:NAD(P)-dependent dehydrogenase (short-subunit alcohol dehydrogenase family)